ncbi:MAG: hypothetical protein AW11_02466 [Candidatus Accumulibacter regalis]|uniref:Lipoprotein n=1 Tax=Accumulibacter regalis TaxID=522306 RepID=A0A011QE38_ACCRE|nr:hypothetical protein [Accumulibacter sp.]EXI87602.1 MAG: hypothetical protein AW11_02466 [Candidatus Accumulibacter regalis]HRE69630.1 hypothetical protein [Accumulibacter sp.]
MFDPLRSQLRILLLAGPLLFGSSGCDMVKEKLGLEEPVAKAARLAAEGQAVGGGCRQSGRAIEDCYSIYSWLPKAAIYQGWRDMDSYMRENKLDTVEPQLPPPQPPGARKKRRPTATDAGDEAKAAASDRSDANPGSERQAGSSH